MIKNYHQHLIHQKLRNKKQTIIIYQKLRNKKQTIIIYQKKGAAVDKLEKL
jgi:hypothetical protein